MKLNDFLNGPHHQSESPVDTETDALASNSPAALPTCAPDALILPTRVHLNAHHMAGMPERALAAWFALCNRLAAATELN